MLFTTVLDLKMLFLCVIAMSTLTQFVCVCVLRLLVYRTVYVSISLALSVSLCSLSICRVCDALILFFDYLLVCGTYVSRVCDSQVVVLSIRLLPLSMCPLVSGSTNKQKDLQSVVVIRLWFYPS